MAIQNDSLVDVRNHAIRIEESGPQKSRNVSAASTNESASSSASGSATNSTGKKGKGKGKNRGNKADVAAATTTQVAAAAGQSPPAAAPTIAATSTSTDSPPSPELLHYLKLAGHMGLKELNVPNTCMACLGSHRFDPTFKKCGGMRCIFCKKLFSSLGGHFSINCNKRPSTADEIVALQQSKK